MTLKRIIRKANYENTYKMAWAKSLVELSNDYKDIKDYKVAISLKDIATKVIKYYWNQTIFFDLIQGSNINKPPLILQLTKDLIKEYKNDKGNNNPIVYQRALPYMELHMAKTLYDTIDKFIKVLKKDVSYRFLHLSGHIYANVYDYSKGDNELIIKSADIRKLYINQDDLYDLINYRWFLILETFNSSPRINKKVRIMDQNDVKRSSLTKFDEYLDYENPNHICFICGNKIVDNELSRDHVIPWSYLYSDDLWNIVYVHKSCNSSKSNIIPLLTDIDKLKERNERLSTILKSECPTKEDKIIEKFNLAIDKDYVDQFYIGCKG